jgi:hypothetical protein
MDHLLPPAPPWHRTAVATQQQQLLLPPQGKLAEAIDRWM